MASSSHRRASHAPRCFPSALPLLPEILVYLNSRSQLLLFVSVPSVASIVACIPLHFFFSLFRNCTSGGVLVLSSRERRARRSLGEFTNEQDLGRLSGEISLLGRCCIEELNSQVASLCHESSCILSIFAAHMFLR